MVISNGDELPDTRLTDFPDHEADPAWQLFESLDDAERAEEFQSIYDSLDQKQRYLVEERLKSRTKVAIAKDVGVSETLVRKELSKIRKLFDKFLLKKG